MLREAVPAPWYGTESYDDTVNYFHTVYQERGTLNTMVTSITKVSHDKVWYSSTARYNMAVRYMVQWHGTTKYDMARKYVRYANQRCGKATQKDSTHLNFYYGGP